MGNPFFSKSILFRAPCWAQKSPRSGQHPNLDTRVGCLVPKLVLGVEHIKGADRKTMQNTVVEIRSRAICCKLWLISAGQNFWIWRHFNLGIFAEVEPVPLQDKTYSIRRFPNYQGGFQSGTGVGWSYFQFPFRY